MTDSQKEGRFGSEFTLVTNIRMNYRVLFQREEKLGLGHILTSFYNQSNSNRQHLRENIRHLILQRDTGRLTVIIIANFSITRFYQYNAL